MKKGILVLGLLAAYSTGVSADQFRFIADIITWTKNAYDYPTQQGPTNWVSPVNYVNGHMYARYEVLQKPSTKLVAVQCCMWQDSFSRESCAPCRMYSTKDIYYFDWGTPSTWWRSQPLDYTRAFQRVYLMHKDGSCGAKLLMTSACGAACYTGSDIDLHVPIQFKVEIYMVSAGATFQPPATWVGNPWKPVEDKTPPTITAVTCSDPNKVNVAFNEALDHTSAVAKANYVIDKSITVNSAARSGNTVTLTTSELTPDVTYTLTVNNIKDAAGNAIAANTTRTFKYVPFTGWKEDFNDGTANGYTTGSGTWSVSGSAYGNTGSGRMEAWYGGQQFGDITYTANVTPVSGTDVWIIFRVQDKDNYLLFTLGNSGKGALYRVQNGSFSSMLASGTGSFTTGTTYAMEVVLSGSSITIKANGTTVCSATDNTWSTGYVGFGANGNTGKFDDATVPSTTGLIASRSVAGTGVSRLAVQPNPFTPGTGLALLGIPPDHIRSAAIYSLAGRSLWTIRAEDLRGNCLQWDGTDAAGNRLPGGIYYLRVRAGARFMGCSFLMNR